MPVPPITQHETGATSHLDRMNLTARLCQHLEPLFDELDIDFKEYGQNIILSGNGSLIARLKKLDVKKSDVICMTKFTPDYVIGSRHNRSLFMMDAKVSITPMFFPSAIRDLQFKSGVGTLTHHNIGEIEREAWDNYVNRFPRRKVAICLASPYHPRLVVAEWASELQALHRFALDTNVDAGGSGTPHVNINLDAMRSLKQFLEDECAVQVDADSYQVVLDDIKEWGLNKPYRVNWLIFNNIVKALHAECPWLKGRLPRDHKLREEITRRLETNGIEYVLF